jgi:hypothetical protein
MRELVKHSPMQGGNASSTGRGTVKRGLRHNQPVLDTGNDCEYSLAAVA